MNSDGEVDSDKEDGNETNKTDNSDVNKSEGNSYKVWIV